VFGFPVARTLGNCLSMANYARLVAMIGAGRVLDMVVTARLTDAVTAKAIGLVSEVAPDHAAVMARAKELAAAVAGHAPITIQTTKEALRRLRQDHRDDEDLIVRAYMSEDFREGQAAFLGKRKPEWKGR
jgi:enoyl-CoA hydratase